jgi:NitT/TauT family transport system ATP-binding protein
MDCADCTGFPRLMSSAPTPPPVLAFRAVSLTYPNGVAALDGVDLTVPTGAFVSLIGPSGCGKTSLLRIAAGLETANSGAVTVDRDQLGFMFQDATLLPWRSVADNVALPLELRGAAKADRARTAAEKIALVGLSDFAGALPAELSGGMKMRAALARTLTPEPRLMLLDEPFAALDELSRAQLNDTLQQLYLQSRFSALMVTHSISEAVFLASEVAVLSPRPGRIAERFAAPFAYPRHPDLRFSAPFTALCGEIAACLRDAGAT